MGCSRNIRGQERHEKKMRGQSEHREREEVRKRK